MIIDAKTVFAITGSVIVVYILVKGEFKAAFKAVGEAVDEIGNAVDPTNQDNIFNRGANEVGSVLTGDDNFNLGSWLYDQLHGDNNGE